MTSYFEIKREYKNNINYTYQRQRALQILLIEAFANNKHAHNTYVNPKYTIPEHHPIYPQAQAVKEAASRAMEYTAQLIPLLQSMIEDLEQLRSYYVSLIKNLID